MAVLYNMAMVHHLDSGVKNACTCTGLVAANLLRLVRGFRLYLLSVSIL
jgi:hypothetical protein